MAVFHDQVIKTYLRKPGVAKCANGCEWEKLFAEIVNVYRETIKVGRIFYFVSRETEDAEWQSTISGRNELETA